MNAKAEFVELITHPLRVSQEEEEEEREKKSFSSPSSYFLVVACLLAAFALLTGEYSRDIKAH